MATQAETRSDPGQGEIFDLLSNQRRRYAIHYCKREGEPVELGDLAEHVAAWELDKEIDELTSAERKRVYTSLQQTHLPTLERADMIQFDDRTIELTENVSDLEIYLDVVPSDSIPWSTYYLGLAAVATIVMGGLWLEWIPTETVPELGWATIVVALFVGSAVVHVVQSRRLRLGAMEKPP
ncbi:DUF7344 domain-containing protein [Natronorubrum bangense]|uniref:DUF7344 domain-containing protein n=2 Tax=Natronorubrum bangense TaxID=61858 RepID=L9WGT1_9EURY|nr:hypothetical protein [Natronorubrum bangense]ELY48725.1 hypothetical protein C494_10470 [Natronorubrum bangense JCM 10635]QCC53884.1 hypothetical protein DV706_04890 [Natronorubrum bangense]